MTTTTVLLIKLTKETLLVFTSMHTTPPAISIIILDVNKN